MCISRVYTCISCAYTWNTRGIHVLHTCEWSSCVCHPQEPPLWPLTHLWVTIQSKVTMREILSLKPREYTWNTHVSHLEIVQMNSENSRQLLLSSPNWFFQTFKLSSNFLQQIFKLSNFLQHIGISCTWKQRLQWLQLIKNDRSNSKIKVD